MEDVYSSFLEITTFSSVTSLSIEISYTNIYGKIKKGPFAFIWKKWGFWWVYDVCRFCLSKEWGKKVLIKLYIWKYNYKLQEWKRFPQNFIGDILLIYINKLYSKKNKCY